MVRSLSSHVLVVSQLVGVTGCCMPFTDQRGGVLELVVMALGIGLGVLTLCYNRIGNFSIYPEPKEGTELIVDGPYRYIRHPMYAALLLMMLGIAAYNGHWLNLLFLVVVGVALSFKIEREERLLPMFFPAYAQYAARTWRLVPRIW